MTGAATVPAFRQATRSPKTCGERTAKVWRNSPGPLLPVRSGCGGYNEATARAPFESRSTGDGTMAPADFQAQSFGRFTLDVRRGCLLRDDQEVGLRPKSFEVLCYLVENRGRLISKRELMDAIWIDTFVTEDSLVQCLIDVRRALGDSSRRLIRTVPRRGYLFSAEDAEPPVRPNRSHRSNNLPPSMTSLIGRDAERATIGSLLTAGEVRLLVLTGPSGTGKTRLAVEVARDLLERFDDGVWFVPLGAISDPGLLPQAMAEALGVKESPGAPLIELLEEHLRHRHALVVLDNFEQITAAAPLVGELLLAAPGIRVVVTSRAPLHLYAEHDFPVSPLPLPKAGSISSSAPALLKNLVANPAVALFVERARAVAPAFDPSGEELRTIAAICRKLDGLPLAIELAAARVPLLPPEAILSRLEGRLELLTHGARDLPERQQSMRGAIAWSHDLLSEDERVLFRRLSLFIGGCSLRSIHEVCLESEASESALLNTIGALVDQSLLLRGPAPGGEPRYALLETIREFGLECLSASGELEAVQRRHARFFMNLAEAAEKELLGSRQQSWLDELEADRENLRAASEWAAGSGELNTALRLDSALGRFWSMRGSLTEGRARLTKLLRAASSGARIRELMKAQYVAGFLADAQGDYATARRLFEENLATSREFDDVAGVANSLNNLGIVALREGDLEHARSLYEESLAIWREIGQSSAIALSLTNLGNLAAAGGDGKTAGAHYRESLAIFRELDDERGIATVLGRLADLARANLQLDEARSLYQESLRRLRALGAKSELAATFRDLGDLHRTRDDLVAAREGFEESMVIYGELGDLRGIASLLERFALIAGAEAQSTRARRLADAASALRRCHGLPRTLAEQEDFDRYLATRGKQPPNTADREIMSVEEAIECALSDS